MPSGVITTWFEQSGFGWIKRDDDGTDVFIHVRYCTHFTPVLGQHVQFELAYDARNPNPKGRANNVRPIGAAAVAVVVADNVMSTTDAATKAERVEWLKDHQDRWGVDRS